MDTGAFAQVHRVVQIDLNDVILTHVDGRPGQHTVDCEDGAHNAIRRYAIRLHTACLVMWTVEARSTEHRIPLHCPIVLAKHWLCLVGYAVSPTWMISVVFVDKKLKKKV